MSVFRGLTVDLSLLGWACFYHNGRRGEIIVDYHAGRFRLTRHNLCLLKLYFGNQRLIREKPYKLYWVPYRQRIQHCLPQHSLPIPSWIRQLNHERDTGVRNHEGDAQVQNYVGDTPVNCHAWSIPVACKHTENRKSRKLEFESDLSGYSLLHPACLWLSRGAYEVNSEVQSASHGPDDIGRLCGPLVNFGQPPVCVSNSDAAKDTVKLK